ncbi:MAG TPA: rhamnulokinase family protein [Armatimonadota bacterium]|nr:rhamnulokinase family protein [Armatimonadota bacterium]
MSQYLALDLGAESGRGVLGSLENGRLELSEIHRFANRPVALPDGLHWNIGGLYQEILHAITRGADKAKTLDGIGVDTWGVDYALLDGRGELLGLPFHYRDHRTDDVMERVFARVSRQRIFKETGIQFMQFNTLFQLAAARERESPLPDAAETLLFLPDLFHFWLSGEQRVEFTIATTSQLYNPVARDWSRQMMEPLGIPPRLFQPVTPPGTIIGRLRKAVASETGAGAVQIILPGSHDTASAVAAAPAASDDFVYISSGTWSLIGIELSAPRISAETMEGNFTNEGGVGGTIRFLKNIMGLWLVQECRRSWARQGREYSYGELAALAEEAPAFACLIDPDDPSFLAPDDMLSALDAFCRRTAQNLPGEPGAIIRACLEGLAFKYRENVLKLEAIAARSLNCIHIVGGGVQNRLLCQFAASATGKPVMAGPIEATAAGNILVQAMARGEIASLRELREVVRASFQVEEFSPIQPDGWMEAYDRFTALKSV